MRSVAILLASAALTGCEPAYRYSIDVHEAETRLPPHAWYEVGDVVPYIADEFNSGPEGVHQSGSSKVYPEAFTWNSTNTRVANWAAPGKLQMLDTGQTKIIVRSSYASQSFMVNVVPRIAQLRETPSSASIAIGETVAFQIEALGEDGKPIEFYNVYRTLGSPYDVDLFSLTTNRSDLVAVVTPAFGEQWKVRGLNPGTAPVTATSNLLYGGWRLGTGAYVTIR